MRITFGRKLFLYTSMLLLAVLLVAFAVLERNQARQWREYLNVQQLAFARFATPELLKHFRGDFKQAADPAHRQQLQGLLSFNPDLVKFTIYSPTGRKLFDPPAMTTDDLSALPSSVPALATVVAPVSQTLTLADGRKILEVLAPAFGPTGQTVLYVRYLFSFQSVEHKLHEMRQTFLLIALVAAICSLLLVALVAKRFTLPIHRLTNGVKAIAGGKLETSIATHGSDEMALLGTAFNEMAANLLANQTELQSIQERMLRTERLAAVGQVAAGVSHEIDNPVGIILGYAQLLLDDCPAGDPRADDLRAIIAECHRCKRITGGLLGLVRTGDPRREPVDLLRLIIETVESLRPQKLFRQIEIHLPVPEEVSEVWADSDRIRQVLMNLFLNAAQAMKGEGEIWVELVDSRAHVVVEVHDNGPGFVDANLERVFEPFFTTKGGGEGTGLGLPICRKLVEEHGGEITATVSPRGGALLSVSLPLRNRKDK